MNQKENHLKVPPITIKLNPDQETAVVASKNVFSSINNADIKAEFPISFNSSRKKDTKPKQKTPKKTESKSRNQTITDFYQIRRSERRCQSHIKEEKYNDTIRKILEDDESGLQVKIIPNKGRGVVTTRTLNRNDFVVEYAGDLISIDEAKQRELDYGQNCKIGCYMYYFNSRGKNYCIDATAESGRLGRLLNHSRTDANCYTKVMWLRNHTRCKHEDLPHLVIQARRQISAVEELLYDYGDRAKQTLEAHPWLKS